MSETILSAVKREQLENHRDINIIGLYKDMLVLEHAMRTDKNIHTAHTSSMNTLIARFRNTFLDTIVLWEEDMADAEAEVFAGVNLSGETDSYVERQSISRRKEMNFGAAIEILKAGGLVARQGWNGKKMFLSLNNGSYAAGQPHGSLIHGVGNELFETGDEGTVTRMPNINMRAANGETVVGWLASQTDMLAEDWEEVTLLDKEG